RDADRKVAPCGRESLLHGERWKRCGCAASGCGVHGPLLERKAGSASSGAERELLVFDRHWKRLRVRSSFCASSGGARQRRGCRGWYLHEREFTEREPGAGSCKVEIDLYSLAHRRIRRPDEEHRGLRDLHADG